MRAPLSTLLVVLAVPGAAAPALAQSPREAAEAWQAELGAAPPRDALAGVVRLKVQVGPSRPVGTAVLRTEVVERDGQQIYRLKDRMSLDLQGLGSVRLNVVADLRADLTAIEVGLETEEPRGAGVVSRQRAALRRDADGWVRVVTRGSGPPEVTPLPDLPERLIVLTPPLGAGERLTRLAPSALGTRLSLAALDLETAQPTTWRASVDEAAEVVTRDGPLPGVLIERREGPARLTTLRDRDAGGLIRRLTLARTDRPRLILSDTTLAPPPAAQDDAIQATTALLHAMARGETERVAERLDASSLYRNQGGDHGNMPLRRAFRTVLVRRLCDPAWIQGSGLSVPLDGVRPEDLIATPRPGGLIAVAPRAAPGAAFVLEQVDGRWLVVRLPGDAN